MSSRDWVSEYQKADALWIHDGNPTKPHAELTSGLHSDGFFYSRKVTGVKWLLTDAAEQLVQQLINGGFDLDSIDVVIGPETGATKLAEHLGFAIGYARKRICHFASPKKTVDENGKKKMVFNERDTETVSGQHVLICDDVLTTGGSITLAVEAVHAIQGTVYNSAVLCLVNRSGQCSIDDAHVISLIEREMSSWKPAECPLCKSGSHAVRPKDNWALLKE